MIRFVIKCLPSEISNTRKGRYYVNNRNRCTAGQHFYTHCVPRHRIQRKQLVSDPGMHPGVCARTCRDACRHRSPAVAGESFQHSRRVHNPQFCVSAKRPMKKMRKCGPLVIGEPICLYKKINAMSFYIYQYVASDTKSNQFWGK